MNTFLTILHVMVCVLLILVVLLQRGKGSDIGAALGGGGSNTVFGSRGAGNFLTKLTTGAAITYMLTSLSLSYVISQEETVFDSLEIEETIPAETDAASGLLEEIDTDTDGAASTTSADELIEIDPDADSSE